MSISILSRVAGCCVGVLLLVTSAEAQKRLGAGYHYADVPTAAQFKGKNTRETKVLLDTPHLQLSRIWLPAGTKLDRHSVAGPVSIQVLSGNGSLTLGVGEQLSLDPKRILYLAPGTVHEVEPEKGGAMLLLVEHVKLMKGRGYGRGRP